MEYPELDGFTRPTEAFEDDSPQGLMSQAAFLLTLGTLLRSEYESIWSEMKEYDSAFPGLDPMPMDGMSFRSLINLIFEMSGPRERGVPIWMELRSREEGGYWSGDIPEEYVSDHKRYMTEAARRLFNEPTSENASQLIVTGLSHPNQLVAVCATISSLSLLKIKESGEVFGWLAEFAFRSPFNSVRDLAGRVFRLGTQGPSQTATIPASPPPSPPSSSAAGHLSDSVLFHGTKPPSLPGNPAPANQWWMPGEPFHDYLQNIQRVALYSGPQLFQWEGGYRDDAREIAARNLYDWLQTHLKSPSRLIAHSHGGNVALIASHLTSGNTVSNGPALDIEQLVMLSTPVHWPPYYPYPGRVREVIDIRVRHDLVIYTEYTGVLMFGGRPPSQRIPAVARNQSNPPIREHIISGHWGSHSACYDKNVWQKEGIQL